MRERVTVVTLSVTHSVCHFSILEKAPFSGLKLTSVYILGDDLNRLMTGRCPSKSLQLWPKFHSLFLQNSFDFQKSATFKGLKSSPRMY